MIPGGCRISTRYYVENLCYKPQNNNNNNNLKSQILPNFLLRKQQNLLKKIRIFETSYYSLSYLPSI
jgi:hypothetical protein